MPTVISHPVYAVTAAPRALRQPPTHTPAYQSDPSDRWPTARCLDLFWKKGNATSRSQAKGHLSPAFSMMEVQFWGWARQSAVWAVREYVYVNSPCTSSRTNSALITSWNFPSRHLGHRCRTGLQGAGMLQPRGVLRLCWGRQRRQGKGCPPTSPG